MSLRRPTSIDPRCENAARQNTVRTLRVVFHLRVFSNILGAPQKSGSGRRAPQGPKESGRKHALEQLGRSGRSEAIWDHVQAVKDNWNPFEVYQYALSGQFLPFLGGRGGCMLGCRLGCRCCDKVEQVSQTSWNDECSSHLRYQD